MRRRRVGKSSLPGEEFRSHQRMMLWVILFVAISFVFLFVSSVYLNLFSDPEVLWGTVLAILIIVSLVIIVRSYPGTGRKEREEEGTEGARSELEKMSIRLKRGAEGYQYSQMLCYQELKRTLEDRIRVKHRRAKSGQELHSLVEDDELKALLTTDYRTEFMSGEDRIKEETGEPFKRHMKRLIDAMEALE